MGLRTKRTAGEPLILALGEEAQEDLLDLLQIRQEEPFELAAAVRIVGQILQLLQRQSQMPFADLLSERLRAAEKAVRQLLHAKSFLTKQAESLDGLKPIPA